jgi:hypothetical protein
MRRVGRLSGPLLIDTKRKFQSELSGVFRCFDTLSSYFADVSVALAPQQTDLDRAQINLNSHPLRHCGIRRRNS